MSLPVLVVREGTDCVCACVHVFVHKMWVFWRVSLNKRTVHLLEVHIW